MFVSLPKASIRVFKHSCASCWPSSAKSLLRLPRTCLNSEGKYEISALLTHSSQSFLKASKICPLDPKRFVQFISL
jgi:hypothetical protein